jgi:hypothetical protein
MIFYGWNSFTLDSCKPSKLGLPPDLDVEYDVQRIQKYFHLYWIPFFPIGKKWVLYKRSDKQQYEPNAELLKFLNSLPVKHPTPWYAFALLYLIGLVAVFFSVKDMF